MPNPFPIPRNISTRARRRLKYWLSITVALSRTMPTPMPVKFWSGLAKLQWCLPAWNESMF